VANAQLQVAAKKLESAQKQAQQTADIKFAEATYKVAQAEYDAEKQLLSKNVSTLTLARRKELEANKAFLSIEAATVKNETDKLAVGVAQAELDAAGVQLGLYNIVAPWDAYVNERMKDQGAWIRAGEPVLKIHHMSEMKVVGYIPIEKIRERGWSITSIEGAKIRVSVDITPTQQHVVDSIINFVSSDVDTALRFRISARIKNERIGNSWLLRDGVPARVSIVVE
jgi:multidrug resistance efflux pump